MTATQRPVGEQIRRTMLDLSGAERRVARVLLAAYPIAGLETIAQLAQRAQVSAPTVMRFVAKLGFDGYPAFQRTLREEVQARLTSPLALYEAPATASTGGGILDASLAVFRRSLDTTFHDLPAAEFEAAVSLLAATSKPVLCKGGRFSEILAYYLSAHLRLLRPGVRFLPTSATPSSDELVDVGKKHVVVVFDYRRYQADTIAFARHAAERGATIVLFTDPWLSPVAEVAECVLAASVEAPSPFDSLVPGLALVEALVGGLVPELGPDARRRVEEIERLREPHGGGEQAAA
jgi:DNA-binding MurR/RpiR family transcriptional regulator